MKRFRSFIKEMSMADETNLDFDFIRRAEKVTKFNIDVKDLKPELQPSVRYLYLKNQFPNFGKKDMFMKSFNVPKLNAAIKELKSENFTHFFNMYQFDQSGIGPGELLLYFLIDNSSVGGGGSAGVDLRVGNKEYEAKSVTLNVGRQRVEGFKLGGKGEIAPILAKAQALKKQYDGEMIAANDNKKNAISEINKKQMTKLKQLEPKAWLQIEKDYAKVAGEYFGNTNLVFMYSKAQKTKVGEIIAAGTIDSKAIEMQAITSGTIKPSISLKDIKSLR
jgi:hypothetical protein